MPEAPPLAAPEEVGGFTSEVFTGHLATLPLDTPLWWLRRKAAAYARFESLPMPARRDEAWRFSTLSGLTLDKFSPQEPDSRSAAAQGEGGVSLTFENGRLAGRLSAPLQHGGTVTTILEALRSHPELLRHHFMTQPQRLGSGKFAALHEAFVMDGAFIHAPKGMDLGTVTVTHTASGEGAAVFPHTLVIAEEGSRVTVVERFCSRGHGRRLACGASDIFAGRGARVVYAAAQCWSPRTLSVQLGSIAVGQDASVQSLNLHLGARHARHESLSELQASGGFSEMLALTVARGEGEYDQRTLQIHQAPNTRSDLLYKNVLLDRSRTIFSGLIVVEPDAQKTDAYQSNRNLMLSDEAEASSLPGLEIQANDVRCTHGATTSRIDPEQEFYLKSRGIPKKASEELLVFGFFEEVLSRLENEEVHRMMGALVREHLKGASQ